ncbi:MAG: caspase family protein [bacterium]|nr:caspase family protein [bacterium]
MKRIILAIILCVLLILATFGTSLHAAGANQDEQTTRRFALVVGANYGGPQRVKLRYAVSDAKALIEVLESMGGVLPDDSRLLVEPDRETLFWELNRLKERIIRAKEKHPRVEVIFYYSGHSDERNILLGKEKVSYQKFRDEINKMEADVRIAILDSCASGAFTRLKGGKKKKPFLVDSAYNMKGYAVMTSSSSDEASQESERLKGSFFTHYLNSGLRGAADMSRDGRITLSEAYQFAFNETLAQTEKTVSGPQHPNYNIQMSGTGDVVITDIRQSSAILRIGKNVSGKLFIHNSDQVLVVELSKPAGRTIELGLEEGKYRVINIVDGDVLESRIKLPEGETVDLEESQFTKSDKIDTVARGDLKAGSRQPTVFTKRRFKTNFFLDFNSRFSRSQGKDSWVTGGRFGLTFNKRLSLGFVKYNNSDDSFNPSLPTYGGFIMEYALASRSVFNLKPALLIGTGKENPINRNFFIIEPEIILTLNVTRLINISTGLSYRVVFVKDSPLSPLSWNFSLRLGK